jgi:hypothetical protein
VVKSAKSNKEIYLELIKKKIDICAILIPMNVKNVATFFSFGSFLTIKMVILENGLVD